MKNILSKFVDWLYSLRCKVSGHNAVPVKNEIICLRCRKHFDKPNLKVKIQGIALAPTESIVICLNGDPLEYLSPCPCCRVMVNDDLKVDGYCPECASQLRTLKAQFGKRENKIQMWSRVCACGLQFNTTLEKLVLCPDCQEQGNWNAQEGK